MSPERQRGSALVMAVFVLTVMLLLGTVLMRTLSQESANVGLEVTGTRTWAAAQSGIDWALAQTLNRGGAAAQTACTAANAVLSPGTGLADQAAFDRCQVTVTCRYRAALPADEVSHGFELSAAAECGADTLRVNRTVEALAYD
ncbi:pilus assembly PilX N-terminal domain-containing protein [Ferrimonas balearica]|uniref:pilus assembly PilX N-terminal domain-containing protein n=1 Tax=Ferrimonas balearica TaxID=44012 RepID=UPI001C990248|nr:pilus assembly PilX N-terminal domain-containing protein [Ferrimonas balearica]MBY5922498.1 pilus assembly PilX N-terminal domain-containing protein [Ferrimonas balearica]MBY5995482.1 pilus assembly PilX N-terminal domain-containing protein [Ferrimonas balearica]